MEERPEDIFSLFGRGEHPRLSKNMLLIIQKSDGGHGFDSTDMAALKHCIKEEVG